MPNPSAPSGLAVGKVLLRTPEFALAATGVGWLVVNVWFTPADPWPEWLLVDWLKRVVLLVPLLIHPETFRWIRSAFTQGVYRHESRGLFILRTVSLAILLLITHHLCVLVSAAIFGLFHLNYGWDDVISTALLGVAFAVVYLRTQSIWPVAAGHYLINFTVFAGP